MPSDFETRLAAAGGVLSRRDVVAEFGRTWVDNEIRRGRLRAIFPRAYARPWDIDTESVRLRAALASVGGDVAISHLTALRLWQLPAPDGPIHVTAFNPRHPRGVPGELVVHRTLLPLHARWHDGLPVVAPAHAALWSWPLLLGSEARAPIIEGVRRRLISGPALLESVDGLRRVRGVAELRTLVSAILAGCESELELYGYWNVFGDSDLGRITRQRLVVVGGLRYRIDVAFDEERVGVELDGRRYHAGRDQWERDIARDLALATAGWQIVRFSHDQLRGDPDGCRRAVRAVLATRRHRSA